MSTAARVPETWQLTGDDARKALRDTGIRQLFRDSFLRLRWSDGFSHARSLAFAISLLLVEGIIALVGLTSALGDHTVGRGLVKTLRVMPGPIGEFLTHAVHQARHAGQSQQYLGLAFGLVGALVTGATLMGQLERGMNRLYGIERDRPTFQKYGQAMLLAVTAGVLATLAFGATVFGGSIHEAIDGRDARETAAAVWNIARWPLALGLIMAAMALLFRWSPRRHQPAWSWLAFGATVGVLLWTAVTLFLGVFFSQSSSFGATYGPLAGVVALLLWALLSSVSVLYGAAVAAQLEAVRAGAAEPQDEEKVLDSEPELEDRPLLNVPG